MTASPLGISLGDPGGIGPEVAVKALAEALRQPGSRYVLFGAKSVYDEGRALLDLELEVKPWEGGPLPEAPGLYLADPGIPSGPVVMGGPSAENGRASFLWFEKAVEAAARGTIGAVVTAPVSKTSWRMAGLPWRGHTEYLESLYPGAIMTFWSDALNVALLSHHLPLKEALGRVRKDHLLDFFRSLHRALAARPSGVREILVAGLNPHAGEEGLLGVEEADEIRPAIEAAAGEGIPVDGPFPPDTLFLKALGKPGTLVVALYHDQGLIAFKTSSFHNGVNATLGLPFIRTSPDHGTAFDIAGRGIADPRSMLEAIRLAGRFAG